MYDREVPFELRVQESGDGPQQVGTLELIKVKVLILVRHATSECCFDTVTQPVKLYTL